MELTCQACGASNDDEARYCDQCGTALAGLLHLDSSPSHAPVSTTEAGQTANAPASRQSADINWFGLGVFAAALAAVGWLVFGGGDQPQQRAMSGNTSQAPEQAMEQAMQELEKFRSRLAADPLDLTALSGMYQLYGQINQAEKVQPYVDAALAAVRERHAADKLPLTEARKAVLDTAMAAMSAGGTEAALTAMEYYYELTPERPSTALMIANIYYDIGKSHDSLKWYDTYLAAADPATEASTVLGAQVDRETMRMTIGSEQKQPELIAEAAQNLQEIIRQNPEYWAAQFNLGQAFYLQGDKTQAIGQWTAALERASSAEEKWRCEAAIAEAEGKPVPPAPPGTETAADGSTNPAKNPHASAASAPPAAGSGVDPHAGVGGGADPHAGIGN